MQKGKKDRGGQRKNLTKSAKKLNFSLSGCPIWIKNCVRTLHEVFNRKQLALGAPVSSNRLRKVF